MKVLVIGSGGREHALVWKFSQSKKVDALFCIPGNAGIGEMAECANVSLDAPFFSLISWIREKEIDLVFVGPEEPLSRGISDALFAAGIAAVSVTSRGGCGLSPAHCLVSRSRRGCWQHAAK